MTRVLFFCALFLASGASGLAVHAQPAVPALTGRVIDRAEILSPAAEATLTDRLRQFEDSTTIQVAVLTVPSLNGENLEEWATEVFRTWGLGQASANNGVLLLIARDDRKIRIEVGYGLEGDLTDAEAGGIIRNEMTPRFRNGDFEGGTLSAADAIIGTISGTYIPPEASGGDPPWPVQLLIFFLMAVVPGIMGFGSLLGTAVQRYVTLTFTSLFVGMVGGITGQEIFGWSFPYGAAGAFGLYVATFIGLDLAMSSSPKWQEKRAHRARKMDAFKRARKKGKTSVVVDGVSYSVPTASSSSGGGFSGGGGSSGGGGASGGW